MNNLPFNTLGLCAEEIECLNETYKALKDKYGIQFTGHIDFQLHDFEVFKNLPAFRIRNSYAIKQENNNDAYILFVEVSNKTKHEDGGFISTCDYQTWALSYLKQDFGRVKIRKETLIDKITEILHPIELDFNDDPSFSDTFYVLVNDYNKATKAINRDFRNAVMDLRHEDFIIEIVNHTLIIGNNKSMHYTKALYLADFVKKVASQF
jgi:hypothetical protein